MPLAPPWRTAASGVNAPTTSGGGIASTAWVVAVCPRGQEDWTGVLDGTGETARTVEAGLTALGLAPDEPQAETRQTAKSAVLACFICFGRGDRPFGSAREAASRCRQALCSVRDAAQPSSTAGSNWFLGRD